MRSNKSVRPIRSSMDRRKRPASDLLGLVAVFMLVALLVVMGAFYLALDSSATVPDTFMSEPFVSDSSDTLQGHIPAIVDFRKAFYERYGGQEAASKILQKGIHSFGSIESTALRMVRAAAHNRPFVMAFAGYSVTVGRGNHFQQSFPFVLERVLRGPMKQVLGLDLVVRNGAIGGIPSFPYGWCLEHFMGDDADVVSWDYGMNEGKGAAVLESYVRQALQLPKKPMFIMLDGNAERSKLLESYTQAGILPDALRVVREKIVDKKLLQLANPPVGLRDWDEFGAPKSCPGRTNWHPKKMEHQLIGWMIAMHMVDAMELAHGMMQDINWKDVHGEEEETGVPFPPPFTDLPENDASVTELMYGHNEGGAYFMRDISCRTSFLPAVNHDKVLPSVVVSGLAKTDLDMMEERSDALYKSGWVLDVSKVERGTKKKVEECGGLGYIDMKVALYGIPESGTLRLWLPGKSNGSDDARQSFDDLIICEANESREKDACQLNSDLNYVVGGVEVPSSSIKHINGAGAYLKRETCVNIGIPSGAKITRLGNVVTSGGEKLSAEDRTRLSGPEASDTDVGLIVDITARSNVSRTKGACCVSHIIWENAK